jgi:hypothetical protein
MLVSFGDGDAARAGSTCVGLTCNTIGRRGAGITVNRPSLTLATSRVPRGGGGGRRRGSGLDV